MNGKWCVQQTRPFSLPCGSSGAVAGAGASTSWFLFMEMGCVARKTWRRKCATFCGSCLARIFIAWPPRCDADSSTVELQRVPMKEADGRGWNGVADAQLSMMRLNGKCCTSTLPPSLLFRSESRQHQQPQLVAVQSFGQRKRELGAYL